MSSSRATGGSSAANNPPGMGWSGKPQYGESAAEMDKIRRRAEIRRRLKAEFNRINYNPYKIAAHVEILDPAIQRYMAMRATHHQYWKPTWRSFAAFIGCSIFPIWAWGFFMNYKRRQFDMKCRTGEITYEMRSHRII